jgi:DNA-binding MurR/RpiR family transcriptional regulator
MGTEEAARPRSFDAFKEMLLARREALPPRLVQIATFALDNPDEIAFGTVAAIAAQAEVQPSSLVRFAQTLGYAGFSELQEVFRSRLRQRWPDYRERLDRLKGDGARGGGEALLYGFAEAGLVSIERLRDTVPAADVDRAAALLAAADTIYLLGLRRAFPVSAYFAYALSKLGLRAVLVDQVGALAPEQLGRSGAGDALIAISFTPYTPTTVELTQRAAERGVPVIALTDTPFSPLAPNASVVFEVAEADFAGFRSLSATFCLAAALAVAAGARLAAKRPRKR